VDRTGQFVLNGITIIPGEPIVIPPSEKTVTGIGGGAFNNGETVAYVMGGEGVEVKAIFASTSLP